jgi:hypothetical protein
MYVGIGIGALFLLAAIIVGIVLSHRKKREEDEQKKNEIRMNSMQYHKDSKADLYDYATNDRNTNYNQYYNEGSQASNFAPAHQDLGYNYPHAVSNSYGSDFHDGGFAHGQGSGGITAAYPPANIIQGAQRGGNEEGRTVYEVQFDYDPELSDELRLFVGDTVLVEEKFDDGWGFGLNLQSNEEGAFPLACLVMPTGSSPPERQKRVSSMIDWRKKGSNNDSLYIQNPEIDNGKSFARASAYTDYSESKYDSRFYAATEG